MYAFTFATLCFSCCYDSLDDESDTPSRGGHRQGSRQGRGRRQPFSSGRNYSDVETDSQMDEPRRANRHTSASSRGGQFKGTKKGPPEHCLTGERIEELANELDASELLILISQNEKGFLRAFQHKRFLEYKITLKHLVKLLFDLVESDEAETASHIMSQIFAPASDYAAFVMSVQQLFQGIYTEHRRHIRQENIEAFSQFVRIGKFCIEKIPNNAVKTIQIPLLKDYIRKALLHFGDRIQEKQLLETIEADLLELEMAFDNFEEEQLRESKRQQRKPTRRTRAMVDAERDPPEPFTDLSILPAANELSCEARAFLRPNIVEGPYHHWQHYTDIQFRLLREDFVRPLRKGIVDYLQGESLQGADVRVYTKVKLLQPVSLGSGLGFDISFDCTPLKRVNWSYTKRLINGSLLCISANKFTSIAFATVADRKKELLERGIVTVKFEGSVNGFQLDPASEYTMVESVAYFEAYRHVLSRLQEVVAEHEIDTMPFKQYIVDSTFNDIPLPLYIRFLRAGRAVFDLHGVVQLKHRRLSTRVDLADLSTWPAAEQTDLDHSQMVAMKAALTQDLSVIQGPPGTGKTYIGLKIVQGLLANRELWDPHKKSPILVVCYTNHALDQFLEGIRENPVNGEPPSLTRIGGRCKSELLADCTLFEKVNRAKESRSIPSCLYKDFAQARVDMMTMKKEIEGLMDEIESTKVQLLTEDVVVQYISRQHYRQLVRNFGSSRPIEAWLGLRFSTAQRSSSPFEQLPQGENAYSSDDSDSENEVQIILNDRLVEEREKVYRPRREQLISAFDMTELEEEIDPEGWQTVQMDKKKRQKVIRKQLSRGLQPLSPEKVYNPCDLQPQERWRLYLYWKNRHTEHLLQEVQKLSTKYEESCKDFQVKKQNRDAFVAEGSDVVGMTTTGAAKYNHIIKSIKPKIVIVEEAAEIFEPHIFTSISPSVQQLILIGDHQQLRPKPTCYELETRYNFNVSLFERLIKNGCPYQTLSIQHRMRPEIASLIRPAIYSILYNHETVERYDHVKGIGKDLFFIHHKYAEKSDDEDRKSHSNPHEARYLAALCDYLLKQGYEQSEITMLTLYSGQVIEIKKNLRQLKISHVRTVVVDDFQGEENEIILLSLVRSNREKKIGFVEIENRVCVALSRAKKGMYIIGNGDMLQHKRDTKWPQILKQLKSMNSIGLSLPLQCQIHRDQKVEAETVDDFSKCPEGGCQKLCNTRLDCGHACKRLCHPQDREHKNYKCKEKARKILPKCGHLEMVSCSADITKVKCSQPCTRTLQCGHKCQEKCSSSCTTTCKQLVEKKLSCGHTVKAFCHLQPEDVVCSVPCKSLLQCEHECSGTCGTCARGRLHVQCKVKCGRTLVCEHVCKFPCTPTCPPCTEPCQNFCVHSKCPKMCFEPCTPCQEPCKWRCKHKQCTMRCGEPCNRDPCNEPCTKRLVCGHQCIGLCGEPCPKLCRVCNKDEVTEIFFGDEDEDDARFVLLPDCGHIFERGGLDQWMKIENEHKTSQEIKFKECPKCKTPVKKCLRYSSAIKQYLKDIETIKTKQMEALRSADLSAKLNLVKKSLDETNMTILEELSQLERVILIDSQPGRKQLLMFPHVVKAKLTLLSQIAKVTKILHGVSRDLRSRAAAVSLEISPTVRKTNRDLNRVKEFIGQDYLFEQQMCDAETEIRRLTLIAKVCEFQAKLLKSNKVLNSKQGSTIKSILYYLKMSGWKQEKVSKEKDNEITKFIQALSKIYDVDGLSETERVEIVKAIGLSKGHWFKCPSGHFYCIGECGGAMEKAKCPECGVEIGGTQHTLLATNQLAPEMDGASHAAWSEAANMANFDPQELAQLRFN